MDKKTFKVTDKEGNIFIVNDLSAWCKKYDISHNAMILTANGFHKTHLGMKVEHCNEEDKERALINRQSMSRATGTNLRHETGLG